MEKLSFGEEWEKDDPQRHMGSIERDSFIFRSSIKGRLSKDMYKK